MDKKKLSIAIPASVISDTPHLREKTSKIGLIGRAAAIFRVNEIIVYSDNAKVDQRRDLQFIGLLLNYLETPQYLRKCLFPIEDDLQFAGILPPLRIPSHPLSGKTKHLKIGEYREGVIQGGAKDGLRVDIGVQQLALLRQNNYQINERLTVQVVSVGEVVEVQPVNREDVPLYWGYRVRVEKRPLGQIMRDESFEFKLATARIGDNFIDVACEVGKKWSMSQRVLIAFGAPSRGLHEIAQDEGIRLEEISDFIVNTVPNQGTATVRTEEALLASLAILNVYFKY
jgi:predicted SPOUT superfamily RNA methylase MTH1